MNIITGRTGQPHVTSQQQRDTNSAMFGSGNYVLNVGEKLRASQIDNNTVRIYDGQLSMQGCIASIEANEYEDLTIDNGTIGATRADIIVAHYKKAVSDGEQCTESVCLEVIKGKNSLGVEYDSDMTVTPTLPEINNNTTIREGATDYYFPMYEIIIENVNIKSLTPLFEVVPQDSGWQDISFDSYFQAYSDGQKPQYRKIGKVVEIRGAFKATAELSITGASNSYVLGSIPREFAPSQQIIQICQGSGEAVWTFTLRTDGTMSVSRYRKGTTWTNITTDTWLPVQVMYFVD